jgi:uncharacterized membrane protein
LDINSINLGNAWLWAHFLYWPILLYALLRAPWHILREKESSNVLFASAFVLLMMWQLKILVAEGLYIHLLGTTALTLMFNWQAALIAHGLILLGTTLTSSADFEAFATNGLITGVLPIAISFTIWRLNERYLPANYFIYIFVCAFFAAALGIASIGLTSYALLSAIDNQLASATLDQYLLAFVPLMYPEAFLSGAMLSILVVYRPQWVATFDDSRYLNNK